MSSKDRLCLSVGEAAEVLGVSKPTIYQLCKRADFPAVKIGRRTLISRVELREWVKRQAGGEVDGGE